MPTITRSRHNVKHTPGRLGRWGNKAKATQAVAATTLPGPRPCVHWHNYPATGTRLGLGGGWGYLWGGSHQQLVESNGISSQSTYQSGVRGGNPRPGGNNGPTTGKVSSTMGSTTVITTRSNNQCQYRQVGVMGVAMSPLGHKVNWARITMGNPSCRVSQQVAETIQWLGTQS